MRKKMTMLLMTVLTTMATSAKEEEEEVPSSYLVSTLAGIASRGGRGCDLLFLTDGSRGAWPNGTQLQDIEV